MNSLPMSSLEGGMHFSGAQERGTQVLLFLGATADSSAREEQCFKDFSHRYRIATLIGPLPAVNRVVSEAERIEAALSVVGTKRTTVIGIRDGTPLAQALAALYPDVVRRLVLVDPAARVSPGPLVRLIDRIEMFLPLGLPLRPLSDDFDSRPLLHRIRCPVLVLTSAAASGYARQQSEYIARKIPNARHEWLSREPFLPGGEVAPDFGNRLIHFLQAAAKKPQKNLPEG